MGHEETVYEALDHAHGGEGHWAFGTGFDEPLAGVDTTVPDGVDPADLGTYCLMLGDDALVLAQRLTQWITAAPELEEEVAVANVALDLLGQARLLLSRAAAADPSVVPALPEGSPVPAEDALAFFRDAGQFRNVRLAEVPNGDFAHTIARGLIASAYLQELYTALSSSTDATLAAIAETGARSAFLEGGPTLVSAWLAAGLVDELLVYLAPTLLGGDRLATLDLGVPTIADQRRLHVREVHRFGEDLLVVARPAERD